MEEDKGRLVNKKSGITDKELLNNLDMEGDEVRVYVRADENCNWTYIGIVK